MDVKQVGEHKYDVEVLFKFRGYPLDCTEGSDCWVLGEDICPEDYRLIQQFWDDHECKS